MFSLEKRIAVENSESIRDFDEQQKELGLGHESKILPVSELNGAIIRVNQLELTAAVSQESMADTMSRLSIMRAENNLSTPPEAGEPPSVVQSREQMSQAAGKLEQERNHVYEIACAKAQEALQAIQPPILVSVKEVNVLPFDRVEQQYYTRALSFACDVRPELNWTMQIRLEQAYIEQELPDIVNKIYASRQQELEIKPQPDTPLSTVTEITGAVSAREQRQLQEEAEARFSNQHFEKLIGKERAKTPEDLRDISLASNAVGEWLAQYGIKDIGIPPENIHLIKESAWQQEGNGLYNSVLQAAAIREHEYRLPQMKRIIHEIIHMKSFIAFRRSTRTREAVEEHRLGLTENIGEPLPQFSWLNEAVTEAIAKRIVSEKVLRHATYVQESGMSRKIMDEFSTMQTGDGEPLFNGESFFAYVDKTGQVISENFTYQDHRQLLDTLIRKVMEQRPGRFRNSEAVFDVFAKAMFTGDKEPLKSVVDSAFGPNTFERLGNTNNVRELHKIFAIIW